MKKQLRKNSKCLKERRWGVVVLLYFKLHLGGFFMRRVSVLALGLGLILGMNTYLSAAFTSKSKTTLTATVALTTQGQIAASCELRNLNGSPATQVSWDATKITPTQTKWLSANTYIILHSTLTDSTGGVQIYTDNKAAGAVPMYAGSDNPAGLVGNGSLTKKTLPMCWRAVDVSTTSLTIVQGAPNFPDRIWSQECGDAYPCWLWMKDKGTSGFTNGEDYVIVKDALRGLQTAEAGYGFSASPDYIYFGANFSTIVTPSTYSTNQLIVEAFSE